MTDKEFKQHSFYYFVNKYVEMRDEIRDLIEQLDSARDDNASLYKERAQLIAQIANLTNTKKEPQAKAEEL